MASCSLNLIDHPPFAINFQAINNDRIANRGLIEKIQNIALPTILEYGRLLLVSAREGFWTNISYFPNILRTLFRDNVQSGEDLLVRIGICVALHVIGFVTITIYVFWQNICSMPRQLASYVNQQINIKHFKIKATEIDVSQVPAEITVETLSQVFNEINFTNPRAPGYMSPASRDEDGHVYSGEELASFLNDHFIRRVREREPFLGTPPAWNIAQVYQFYEQIEAAVRFSLNKVINDDEDFKREHPNWGELSRLEAAYRRLIEKGPQQIPNDILQAHQDYLKYDELLKAKARVAIDLAIAGKHCGGRYMGDAMDLYFFHKGEVLGETLEDNLEGVLAKKREEIARQQIQIHLGQDTHGFSAYMANLGGLLGIPGTQNVVENLGFLPNRGHLITSFFEEYTPACIRQAIQEKFSSSQTFRERIYDWLKANSRDWNQEAYQKKLQAILNAVRGIQPDENSPILTQIHILKECISSLIQKGLISEEAGKFKVGDEVLPEVEQWTDFLSALSVIPKVRSIVDPLLGQGAGVQIRRNEWKKSLENELFVPAMQKMVGQLLRREEVSLEVGEAVRTYNWMLQVIKILKDQEVPSLPLETLIRCSKKEANFEEVVTAHLENQRHSEFLDALRPDRQHQDAMGLINDIVKTHEVKWCRAVNAILKTQGVPSQPDELLGKCFRGEVELAPKVGHRLTPEILEWVLVAHDILNPPVAPV